MKCIAKLIKPKPPADRPRLVLNEETIKAIEAARRGETTTVSSVEELFAILNADYSQ